MPKFFEKYETLKPKSHDDIPAKYDTKEILKCLKSIGYKCSEEDANWVIRNYMNSLDSYHIAGIIIETLNRREN